MFHSYPDLGVVGFDREDEVPQELPHLNPIVLIWRIFYYTA